VVAVDEDVDIYDLREVEWTIATRFQADKDLIVITGLEGSTIDPSTNENYLTAKVGIDATRPSKEEKFDKIRISPESKNKAKEIWKKYINEVDES
jgi:3-polyprenyl-4-hydroxybenzoate decarboxylase